MFLTWGPDDTQSRTAVSFPPVGGRWDDGATSPTQQGCSERETKRKKDRESEEYR